MIGTKYKSFFNQLIKPFAMFFVRLGISPNVLTVSGLIFGAAVSVFYVQTENTVLFYMLIACSGLFDVLDGAVARLSGKISKFGGYLDAMCDRFFDGFVAIAVAMVTGHWVLIFLLYMNAFGVSYAKARAAIEVQVSNTEWPDLMERMERSLIFMTGLLISELTGIELFEQDLFFWILIFLNLAVAFTVVQRILRAKKVISERS